MLGYFPPSRTTKNKKSLRLKSSHHIYIFKYPILLWKAGSQNPSQECVLHSTLPVYIYIYIIPTTSFNNNNNKHPVACHPADHISLASSAWCFLHTNFHHPGPPLTLYLSLQCLVFLLKMHNTDSVFSKVGRGGQGFLLSDPCLFLLHLQVELLHSERLL